MLESRIGEANAGRIERFASEVFPRNPNLLWSFREFREWDPESDFRQGRFGDNLDEVALRRA